MSATETLKALFAKRDNLAHEQREVQAALAAARRTWAAENGLLMLPSMDRIERQVMA